jgi:hypothetical protein
MSGCRRTTTRGVRNSQQFIKSIATARSGGTIIEGRRRLRWRPLKWVLACSIAGCYLTGLSHWPTLASENAGWSQGLLEGRDA